MLKPDRSRKKVLGISISERALLVAEVVANGKGPHVTRVAEFPYPQGVSLGQADALGRALADFLRNNGFSTRCAIFGVPAKWLMLKPHALPPANIQTAQTMLRLQAELQASAEVGQIVFDYLGESDPDEPTTVTLVGLPARWLDRMRAIAAPGRLKVLAVTPSAAALCTASALRAESPVVLSLRPDCAEIAAYQGNHPQFLRHLGPAAAVAPLVAELRRTAAMFPMDAAPPHTLRRGNRDRAARSIVLWDEVGLDPAALEAIGSALGLPAVRGDMNSLGSTSNGLDGSRVGASAVALTLPILKGQAPAIDFLHPRLAPPKEIHLPRRAVWLTTAGVVLALAGGLAYADLARLQHQVAQVETELHGHEPKLKIAKPFVTNMEFARSFEATRPQYLACLKEITLAMPDSGQTYLTSFRLQADMKGEFAGRSASDQDVLNLLDKLSATGRFSNLNRKLDAHGSGPEMSFYVTFNFAPRK